MCCFDAMCKNRHTGTLTVFETPQEKPKRDATGLSRLRKVTARSQMLSGLGLARPDSPCGPPRRYSDRSSGIAASSSIGEYQCHHVLPASRIPVHGRQPES